MNQIATDRVAPEKADFRPALLSFPHAGSLPERDMSEYTERLKDPRWQKKRLEILSRDEWRCTRCYDSESTLHVHHRFYTPGAMPWEYDNNALATLCESCHATETEEGRAEEIALLQTLKLCGAMSFEMFELKKAFTLACGNPLDEVEWTIACSFIQKLLESRNEKTPFWSDFSAEYFAKLRRKNSAPQ